MSYLIDGLQYSNWSESIFRQLRTGGVDSVHVTLVYHENFRETVARIEQWNRWFERWPELIFQGFTAKDISLAQATGRTAIFFGAQNPSCIEDDIGLVQVLYRLGLRFMQLSYNNQSLLATGCYEAEDTGLTRMGREVVAEMNRVGMVIDMSHSSERSTMAAMEHSSRPITVTHANPATWHPALRNKSDLVIGALAKTGGMLGFSLYPHHLKGGSACQMTDFCTMIARTAERFGTHFLGIGTDLCQDQPDSVVEWMRTGRWTKSVNYGEGSKDAPGFPAMPDWFRDNRDFANLQSGLLAVGFSGDEIAAIMGENWARFFATSIDGMASDKMDRAAE